MSSSPKQCLPDSGSASEPPEDYGDLSLDGNLVFNRFIDPFFETVFETHTSFPFHVDLQLLCPERDLLGRSRHPYLPDLAYELFQVLPLDESPPLPFKSPQLNLAVGCVLKFFQLRATHNFYHCTVPVWSMDHFIDALMQEDSATFMLPFSAWCDVNGRPHRHFLLVAPRGGGGRYPWPSAWKKRIRKAMHLVNAMGYLSQSMSRCNGTLRCRTQGRLPPLKPNQFFILTSLPVHFRLPLAMHWAYGFEELLEQEFRAKDRAELEHLPRKEGRFGDWQVAVRDLPGINLRPVLPVTDAFVPTTARTDHFLYIHKDRKVYFEKILEKEEEEECKHVEEKPTSEANGASTI